MDTTDPPCDFDTFVAQRRGISSEQAERLVQCWLEHYLPYIKRAAQLEGVSRDLESPSVRVRSNMRQLSALLVALAR